MVEVLPVDGAALVVVPVVVGVTGALVVLRVEGAGGALEIETVLASEPQPASSPAPRTAIGSSRRIEPMVGPASGSGCTCAPGAESLRVRSWVMSTQIPPQQKGSRPPQSRRTSKELVRTGLIVVLAVYFTLFAVLNLDDIKVNWVFGSGHAPLIIVIVICLLVGIVLTYFAERRGKRGQR